jgi:hypothetical protein
MGKVGRGEALHRNRRLHRDGALLLALRDRRRLQRAAPCDGLPPRTLAAGRRSASGPQILHSLEPGVEPFQLPLVQVLSAVREQAADLVERIVLVATVPENVLLDATPDLVDHLGAEPHDMEGVD